MTSQELDQILRHTLSDYRVSRGEKRILNSILQEMDADRQDLGVLRARAFDIAREEMSGPQSKEVLEWLEEIVKLLIPRLHSKQIKSEAFFSPGDSCPRKIIGMLDRASSNIDICVFTITDDRISDAVVEAHRRKVTVRVISDNDKSVDRGSDVDRLRRAGVPLRVDSTDNHMHHKFAVFDRAMLLTGSYNWTRSADRYNEENFVVTNDATLVKEFSTEFERLWRSFE